MGEVGHELRGLTSEEEPGSDKDAEYLPESNIGKRQMDLTVDPQTKLQYLLDQIDVLTHSLNSHSPPSPTPNGSKRRHGPENEDEKSLVSKDKSLYTIKLEKQPPNIRGGTMRDYQLEGLNWLLKMHVCSINGILADEMGLGKTLQTISLLSQLATMHKGKLNPHIIIVPKSTLANWVKEFKYWCPSLDVFEFYGNQVEREQLRPKVPRTSTYDVLMTTYEIAMAEKTVLKGVKFEYLIIDEAHRIKNEKSVLSQVVRLFSCTHRLLLTGTPLQNNLHELWALLNFLMPQIFSSAKNFDEWFDLSKESQDYQENLIKQLHRILRPFMLRRLKREVENKLPPKKELYVFLGMTDLQKDIYKKILTKNIDVVNGFGEKTQLMNTIMQLRKVCNHPYLFDGVEEGPPYLDGDHLIYNCMKFKFLDKLIPRIIEKGKLLIFTQMTRLLDILEDFFNYRGYRFCRIDGSTQYMKREMQIEEFQRQDSGVNIFILSTRAGGVGINLHSANTVIIFDSDWNPQVDIQAMDRAHRIGQTRTVTVFRFVTEGTVEEKIAERAAKKLKMDHLVIQKGTIASQNKGPSIQEMNQIVQFGAQQVLKSTGPEVLEEDIDQILEYAEEKTQEMNKELAKLEEAFNLNNFRLDGSSLYEFEGNDYKKVKKEHISLGARKRKTTGFYDVEKYYNNLEKKKAKKKGWRALYGGGHPHQFFNTEELDSLEAKEEKWNDYLNEKTRRTTRASSSDKPEKFTEKDKQYKKQLLSQGFVNWTKKDFNNFIKGCETYGRESYKEIAEEIGTKTVKEVKTYSAEFWNRFEELHNGTELVERIKQGEKDIERLAHIENLLSTKRKREEDKLGIDYSYDPQVTHFTTEEDKFLLTCLFDSGYGNWDEIRTQIKQLGKFRFNFWLQTRSEANIQERCDYLVNLIEMEINKAPKKQRKIETEGLEVTGKGPRVEVTSDFDWVITLPKYPLP